jgi:hypothetical protein
MNLIVSHQNKVDIIDVVGIQVFAAEKGWFLESRADSVKNGFNLKLASEGLIVNHH